MRQAILLLAVGTAACGPGLSDFSDRISDTQYVYWRTDSMSYGLSPRQECGPTCPSIERNIVSIDWNDHAIAARRQVVKDYRCEEGYTESLWLNLYEQYVIILATNELIGPMSLAQYRDFRSRNLVLLDGIELLGEHDNFDGNGLRYGELSHCTNPVPS